MAIANYYTALLAFLLGVFLVFVSGVFSLPLIVWLMGGACVLALVWRRAVGKGQHLLLVSIFLMGISLGALRAEVASQYFGKSVLNEEVGQLVVLSGVVIREPEQRERSLHLYVKIANDTVLVTTERYAPVAYGDKVKIEGELEKPESFTTDFGRTFNYPGYLLARGVEYRVSFASVAVLSTGHGQLLIDWLLKSKSEFISRVTENITEPAAGLGVGLLLGVKQALGEDLETAFRKSGIIHIVVLSGYNIMLVVTFVMYLLSFLLPLRQRMVVGLIAISLFALLVGLSATVVRASIMAGILLLAQTAGRQYLALRSLILAAVIMVAINPYLLIYDTGFQLSFIATLGLILIAPVLEFWLIKLPNIINLRSFLVATLAAQIAVLPFLLYQIGELSVVSVLVNMIVLPMVPIAMLLTFATGLVSFISTTMAAILAIPTTFSLFYIIKIAEWFSALPVSTFVLPPFSVYTMFILYIILGLILWWLHKRGFVYSDALVNTKGRETLAPDINDWTIEEEVEVVKTKTPTQ